MARQSTLDFFASSRKQRREGADKEPISPNPDRFERIRSRESASPIASSDAPSPSPGCYLSASPLLPATLAMESSFELPDSTDWLSTSLPAFEPLEAALRCEVCKEFYNNPVITNCAHTFCSLCIRRCIANDGKCPACKSMCQADKLQPNIAVRDIATKFQEARPKALELARVAGEQDKEDKGDGQTATPASGRKRKRGAVEDEDEGRRTTRARQTRQSARHQEAEGVSDDMPLVVPDSEDEEDEYQPGGMSECPICRQPMKIEAVFYHVPGCSAAQKDDEPRKTRSGKTPAFPTTLESRPKASAPPPTRLSSLHYPMLTEKGLRKKLQELGIPTWGAKPLLIRRHQEWLNLYNSNCDASDNVRKSKRELLRELDEWERTQGGSATTKESQIMRKDFDGQTHATTHKTQFDDLIANARKRAKAAVKAKEETSPSTGTDAAQPSPLPHPPRPNTEQVPDPAHPYQDNESALSAVRRKVEEANQTDSALPALNQNIEDANLKAAQDAQDKQVSLGLDAENPFGSPSRKVPMFKMPEEPVIDVESSTIQ